MKNRELVVCMPTYNEAQSLDRVVREWIPTLRKSTSDFEFWVIDDGSRDDSSSIIKDLQKTLPEIRLFNKENSGHGRSCLFGYRKAVESKAQWIFQIDSDGQCDPSHFSKLWELRPTSACIYGNRVDREDGFHRRLISKVLAVLIFLKKGRWILDPNSPYRLFRTETLENWISDVDPRLDLGNLEVAVQHAKRSGIHWVPISFRNRFAGQSHSSILKMGSRVLNFLKHSRA